MTTRPSKGLPPQQIRVSRSLSVCRVEVFICFFAYAARSARRGPRDGSDHLSGDPAIRAGRCARSFKPVGRLVPVSFTHCCASTPGLSTWWSSTVLIGIPGFEGGFPLRCFQRLSRPYLATQRCHWRDNWYTRGTSIPVLSY